MKDKNIAPEAAKTVTPEAAKGRRKRRLSRRLRRSGYATVMIIAVVAVIVVLNVIVTSLGNMYGLSLDLTTASTYDLSAETVDGVKTTLEAHPDKEVEIYMLFSEAQMSQYTQLVQLESLARNFANLSEKIHISYVDLVKEPTFVSNYPDLTLTGYQVLMVCDKRAKVLEIDDLFTSKTDETTGQTTYTSNVEQKLLSGLISVTADSSSKVAFLGGHDEMSPQSLIDLLKDNNYEISLNEQLAVGLTQDFDALVICAPSRDYSEEELKALDAYLNNGDKYGKNVFYFAEISQPELPNLEAFLSEWGIQIGSGVSVENDANRIYYQNPYYPIASYADESDKYSGIFSERNVNLVTPRVREMALAFAESRNRTAVVLLRLSETGYVIEDVENPNTFDDAAIKGSIPVAIAGSRAMYDDDGNAMQSIVFGIASYSMLDTSLLNNNSVLNGDYIANLFNRTLQSYELIYIAPKDFSSQAINITSGQANLANAVFTYILPGVVLVCGLVVYLRRRHL